MSRVTGRHTRPKKLTSKQNVSIFREEQIDTAGDNLDAVRSQIETGVEKAEESEYHLQQAIKASQAVKQDQKLKDAYIPTPPTISSDVQYDVLYPKIWTRPATYIRSSATVEDCRGCPYDMDEEDEIALQKINAQLGDEPGITEDQFEEAMSYFEETTKREQPFATVDGTQLLTLDEMESRYDDTISEPVRRCVKYVYEHWTSRRAQHSGAALGPQLKSEGARETDDTDPYVTFRRREHRQQRKTRQRDLQSVEKLRKLRIELETARNILLMVKQREILRRENFLVEQNVCETRAQFRETKRKLKITTDDDLLINVKKPKIQPAAQQEQVVQQQLQSIPVRSSTSDLKTIDSIREDRSRTIEHDINTNIDKHKRWNEGYVDATMLPLTPDIEQPQTPFISAMPAVVYLPTPPASVSEDEKSPDQDIVMEDADVSRSSTPFDYASAGESKLDMPQYRRRIGRGGRLLIDRRMSKSMRHDFGLPAFKYDDSDQDSDNDLMSVSTADAMQRRMFERLQLSTASSSAQAANARRVMAEQSTGSHSPAQAVSLQASQT